MGELTDISIDGEKHRAMIIKNFTVEGKQYSIYAIPNGDGTYEMRTGTIKDNMVVDIEDEREQRIISNIVKTILNEEKKENFLNMDSEEKKFSAVDENGVLREGTLIGEYEVEGNDYVLYSLKETEEKVGIYIKKFVTLDNGEEDLVSITDPDEKELVFTAMREYIDDELGD